MAADLIKQLACIKIKPENLGHRKAAGFATQHYLGNSFSLFILPTSNRTLFQFDVNIKHYWSKLPVNILWVETLGKFEC